jgi:hypothetical protein
LFRAIAPRAAVTKILKVPALTLSAALVLELVAVLALRVLVPVALEAAPEEPAAAVPLALLAPVSVALLAPVPVALLAPVSVALLALVSVALAALVSVALVATVSVASTEDIALIIPKLAPEAAQSELKSDIKGTGRKPFNHQHCNLSNNVDMHTEKNIAEASVYPGAPFWTRHLRQLNKEPSSPTVHMQLEGVVGSEHYTG